MKEVLNLAIFGKKEQKVIEKLKEHLDCTSELLKKVEEILDQAMVKDWSKVRRLMDEIHTLEHKADVIRREMEATLYEGAFLPNFRGDLLNLVEALDKIANRGETVAHQLTLERVDVPSQLVSGLRKQIQLGYRAFNTLKDIIVNIFEDLDEAAKRISEVERVEHEEDQIELQLIETIFSLDIPLAHKIQLKQLVLNLGDISDMSEDCSDIVQVIVFKRRV